MVMDGYGILKYKNGNSYCGDFVKGIKEGKGLYQKSNGETISGVWKDDKLIMGQQRFPDGVYFGSFNDEVLPEGKGIFQWDANGDIYQGSWKNGL